MKNYITMGSFTKGKKPEVDLAGKTATPFPKEKVVMSIYCRPAPHESRHKLELTSQAVSTVRPAAPEYLHLSESLITFDLTDHPNSNPSVEGFPS
jgi:hypothetical protein